MAIQRVRDPVHNLIQFDTTNSEIERVAWKLIQSRPFQRLRRVKQLGFSELVYPGATHTRFAHSIGVFHTARNLMNIVQEKAPEKQETSEKIALVAALVHDVGHGPFSHAFEAVGERLNLKLADHEVMSDELIRNGEIAEILNNDIMSGFASNVANMIKKEGRITLHNSVVSSQFDADRLDYMQRDRLMTGSQHSVIDLAWLLANLDVGQVAAGIDETKVGSIPTFVIGPKAIQAAEAYVLGLFQLYPTIYFHKATRGAEKLFSEILVRLFYLVRNGDIQNTGLPKNHPLVRFANDPESIETALSLDDAVVWGAMHLMIDSEDPVLSSFSDRLLNRKLFKCFDIRAEITHRCDPHNSRDPDSLAKIEKCCASAVLKLQEWQKNEDRIMPRILTDQAERRPYKTNGVGNGQTEQINVRTDGGELIDIKQRSEIVNSLSVFKLNRVYYDDSQKHYLEEIQKIVYGEID
ncbi:HD domain-containing protein [Martelella lutilitoris]|uniref:HD domain-containing protein n=1 Tax=Martelella lutilitoris TaxID=2583532 RepID=A0A5C4JUP5_9HYPH|nr:HD domain-containing protein [Martelella lutilitoris]TNB48339.1 HD domain-containing protein [Martelella lutilitoris]